MASDSYSGFPTRGITHFFYRLRKAHTREWKKEQSNKHGLGSAPGARKGVCDTFAQLSAHLQTIAGVSFVQNFYKNH